MKMLGQGWTWNGSFVPGGTRTSSTRTLAFSNNTRWLLGAAWTASKLSGHDGMSFGEGLFLSSTRRVASLEGGVRTGPLVSQVKVHFAGMMESSLMKRLG